MLNSAASSQVQAHTSTSLNQVQHASATDKMGIQGDARRYDESFFAQLCCAYQGFLMHLDSYSRREVVVLECN